MTDLFRWAGYGDNDTPFDHEATAFNPLFVYGIDDGEPCLVYTPVGSQTFVGKSPLGSPASLSVRMGLKLSAYPSSSVPIIAPLTSGGTSAWRIRLSSTGTLIIDNPSNTATGTTAAIPLNTHVMVKILATATTVKIRIYNAVRGGTLIGTETTGTNTFGLVDYWRQGQAAASPIVPPYRVSQLLITDDVGWLPDPPAPATLSTPRYGIIGDSLTAMSGANGEYLRQALLSAGIPPRNVYLWGVGGKRIAVADLTGKTSAQNIQDAKNVLTTIDHWIVALGTNDRPQVDATVNADIDTILSAIGATAKVTWIGLTSKGSASADDIRLNGLIAAKLTARGNAVLADWNTYIRAIDGGDVNSALWLSGDTTHMSATGYPVRAAYMVARMIDPISGTVAQTLPAIVSAAAGAVDVPVFTGAAATVLPSVAQAAEGTAAVPVFSGAAASMLPPLVTALTGAVTCPVTSGEVASILPALTTALSGAVAAPQVTGAAASLIPAVATSATGQVSDAGEIVGTMASMLPAIVVIAIGTIAGEDPPAPSLFPDARPRLPDPPGRSLDAEAPIGFDWADGYTV